MSAVELLFVAIAAWPAVAALACLALRGWRFGLYAAHLIAALALCGLIGALIAAHGVGVRLTFVMARPLPDLELGLTLDPLGLTFAALFAGLHLALAAYRIGHDQVSPDPRLGARMAAAGAIAACLVIAALARDLLTMLAALVGLALAIFAIQDTRDPAPGRLQLGVMLGAALAFAAPGAAWIFSLGGDLRIQPGGAASMAAAAPAAAAGLFALIALGFGVSLLAPFSFWLRRLAQTAPAPTAASVHGLVAPGLAFLTLKAVLFSLGPAMALAGPWPQIVQALAWLTAIAAALIGLTRADLAERLAFIGASQGGLALAALLTGAPAAAFGAALQIGSWAVAMTCLSMAAGAIAVSTQRVRADALDGVGRRMPVTFVAFGVAALSLAGLAPFAGAWAKLWMAAGAGSVGDLVSAALVMVSAVLALALLAPVAARALFWPAPINPFVRPDSLPLALVAPIAVLAVSLIALLWAIDPIGRFILPELGQ
jgi:multicomponent Na+:H+ antiporter subunit D